MKSAWKAWRELATARQSSSWNGHEPGNAIRSKLKVLVALSILTLTKRGVAKMKRTACGCPGRRFQKRELSV